jgi:hypothetical protein
MRTTVRIDDDLMRDLKKQAQTQKISFTKLINAVLRRGIDTSHSKPARKALYREKTFSMGPPKVDLTKALALSGELEDEEIIRKLALGK